MNDDDMRKHIELSVKSSMLLWYPKTRELDIPQPKTLILGLTESDRRELWHLLESNPIPKDLKEDIMEGANKIGYPLFMRTDQGSGKHQWNHTCFVTDVLHLFGQLANLVEWHETLLPMGMPISAIVFREYIDMDSKFRAFEGLPISPERRYFIRDGKIEDHCTYWPEQAIKFYNSTMTNKDLDWKSLLAEMNRETPEEIELLTRYSLEIGKHFPEYWSVDYCRGFNGKWYMIDMARGEVSWNPKTDKKLQKNTESVFEDILGGRE